MMAGELVVLKEDLRTFLQTQIVTDLGNRERDDRRYGITSLDDEDLCAELEISWRVAVRHARDLWGLSRRPIPGTTTAFDVSWEALRVRVEFLMSGRAMLAQLRETVESHAA